MGSGSSALQIPVWEQELLRREKTPTRGCGASPVSGGGCPVLEGDRFSVHSQHTCLTSCEQTFLQPSPLCLRANHSWTCCSCCVHFTSGEGKYEEQQGGKAQERLGADKIPEENHFVSIVCRGTEAAQLRRLCWCWCKPQLFSPQPWPCRCGKALPCVSKHLNCDQLEGSSTLG